MQRRPLRAELVDSAAREPMVRLAAVEAGLADLLAVLVEAVAALRRQLGVGVGEVCGLVTAGQFRRPLPRPAGVA